MRSKNRGDAKVSKSFNAKPSLFRASAGIPASGSHVQATFLPPHGQLNSVEFLVYLKIFYLF
jgi:hypothetical protein